MSNPADVLHGPVFYRNFWDRAANDCWATETAMDPLTTASKAADSRLVGPSEFRASDEDASLLRPPVGRYFQVWELKPRLAPDGKMRHNWRLGVRLGSGASGACSQWVSGLNASPSGIREAGFREVM